MRDSYSLGSHSSMLLRKKDSGFPPTSSTARIQFSFLVYTGQEKGRQ